MKNILYICIAFLTVGMYSCKPTAPDKPELGPLPNPSFTIVQGDTPNEFILTNTTEGAFMTQWNIENNGSLEGEQVTASIPFVGDYLITMTTFSSGGSASASQTVTVTVEDPNACSGNINMLTGCGSRTWTLANEVGALFVNDELTSESPWWQNSEADLGSRACHFDDTYTFTLEGVFDYNNNGDFWADTDASGNLFPADLGVPVGCNPAADLESGAYAAWSSGTHEFSITESTLTVIGEGAWIGLYKIGTNSEVGTPQQEVTFQISEISDSRMVLFTENNGEIWRITLTAI